LWFFSLLGVLEVLSQQVQTFGCVFCVLKVLFQQVQTFGYVFHALEVHVGLPKKNSMFLKYLYFGSCSNDPRPYFPLVMALMVTICIFHI
jgi:hypothetical protein